MNEDFRKRYQPAPSRRPVQSPHITDLRLQAQPPSPPVEHRPPEPPPPQHQPPAYHQTPPRPPQADGGRRRKPAAVIIGLLIIGTAGFLFIKHNSAKTSGGTNYFPSSVSGSQMSIQAYYPIGLPAGFKVSGSKIVKQNTLSYVVSNPNNDLFYVTVQPQPSDSELAAYKKKITHQTEYTAPAGKVLVGTAGNSLTGSVETTKNDWILLNTTAVSKTNDLDTIIHAMRPVSL
jgi:hypothetical protein